MEAKQYAERGEVVRNREARYDGYLAGKAVGHARGFFVGFAFGAVVVGGMIHFLMGAFK